MECIEKHRHFQRGMPASSILNFRYFTCLLDKGHISPGVVFLYLHNILLKLLPHPKSQLKHKMFCIQPVLLQKLRSAAA